MYLRDQDYFCASGHSFKMTLYRPDYQNGDSKDNFLHDHTFPGTESQLFVTSGGFKSCFHPIRYLLLIMSSESDKKNSLPFLLAMEMLPIPLNYLPS